MAMVMMQTLVVLLFMTFASLIEVGVAPDTIDDMVITLPGLGDPGETVTPAPTSVPTAMAMRTTPPGYFLLMRQVDPRMDGHGMFIQDELDDPSHFYMVNENDENAPTVSRIGWALEGLGSLGDPTHAGKFRFRLVYENAPAAGVPAVDTLEWWQSNFITSEVGVEGYEEISVPAVEAEFPFGGLARSNYVDLLFLDGDALGDSHYPGMGLYHYNVINGVVCIPGHGNRCARAAYLYIAIPGMADGYCETRETVSRDAFHEAQTYATAARPEYRTWVGGRSGAYRFRSVLNEDNLNYQESDTYCVDTYGTHLAKIDSEAEMEEAAALCELTQPGVGCYIGLNDDGWMKEGTYSWVFDQAVTAFGFTDADPTQPTVGVCPWMPGALSARGDCIILEKQPFAETVAGGGGVRPPYLFNNVQCNSAAGTNFVCMMAVTAAPTAEPSPSPSPAPTDVPTPGPTKQPTASPTPAPTGDPTPAPTGEPTPAPTTVPSPAPTAAPSPAPTAEPTPSPTFGKFRYASDTDGVLHAQYNSGQPGFDGVLDLRMTASRANQYCMDTFSSTLASVLSAAERAQSAEMCALVNSAAAGTDAQLPCFIGLHDDGYIGTVWIEGKYQWADGSPAGYGFVDGDNERPSPHGAVSPWDVGQPSDQSGVGSDGSGDPDVDCIAIDAGSGLWQDISCDDELYFLCNRAPPFQPVAKQVAQQAQPQEHGRVFEEEEEEEEQERESEGARDVVALDSHQLWLGFEFGVAVSVVGCMALAAVVVLVARRCGCWCMGLGSNGARTNAAGQYKYGHVSDSSSDYTSTVTTDEDPQLQGIL